jgi:hypothetical protein
VSNASHPKIGLQAYARAFQKREKEKEEGREQAALFSPGRGFEALLLRSSWRKKKAHYIKNPENKKE